MGDYTDDRSTETTADYIRRLIIERNEAQSKLEQIQRIVGASHGRA